MSEFFKGWSQDISVNPVEESRSTKRRNFTGCAIGLNLHAEVSTGHMEWLRMALFVSNKVCALSESLDAAEMPVWDSIVRMPAISKPDMGSRFARLKEMFLLATALGEDRVKLA